MTDVKVGLGIADDGTLNQYLKEVREVDKAISALLNKAGTWEEKNVTIIRNLSKKQKAIQTAIQSYTKEQFTKLTPKQQQDPRYIANYEATMKGINQLQGDIQRRIAEAQKKAARQFDLQQQELTRNQRNQRLKNINSAKDIQGLSQLEARQLAGQARYMARYESARGLGGAAKSEKRLELLTNYLRDLAKPGITQRQEAISGFMRNKSELTKFIKSATPEILNEYQRTARKMGRTAFDAGDTTRGQSLTTMAGQFKTAMAQMAPTFVEVQRVTKDLLSSRGKILRGVSRENLQQTQQQASILRREMNKAYASGDTKNAARYEQAFTKLNSKIMTVKEAPRLSRINELTPLAGSSGDDFNNRLAQLVNGRSIASMEGLRGAADKQYKSLLAQKDDKAAEGWRQVVAKLDEQIKVQKAADSPKKATTEQTIAQKQAEIDNKRIASYASSIYDGRALGKDRDVLERMSAEDLRGLQRQGNLRLKAQQFRVDSATGPAKAEEERLLKVLQEQLRTLEQQLSIRKRIDQQRANNQNTELQTNRQLEEAKKAAQRNSPEANQARVAQGLEQRRLVREMDGGAEMFRNQMMLLRNYAVMGAGVGGAYSTGSFIVGLDKSFKQLQSILALTNNDMAKLKGELIQVSELTKFDALEVVDTSVILGQAGLNKEQIVRSIEGITLFATAIGTDLKSAVDLATSTMGVFNIEASRMPEIVDKLTISINRSKLNMDKLSLGIQYAGNIAEQSNVSFEDTVAALAAMANSGIKSGSTLGTGLRQILITLQKPSDAFKQKMRDLGITMDQLDLKTHSLTDVMATLSGAGFTVVDAMQTMEVRAAAAFGAYANNIDTARQITEQMQHGGAATQANTTQMEALANQWARFASVAKSIFYDALAPMVDMLTIALTKTTDWLVSLKEAGDMVQYIVAGLVTLGALKSTMSIFSLGVRLLGGGAKAILGRGAAAGAAGAAGATTAATTAGAATAALSIVRTILGGPWIWGLAAAGAVGSGVYSTLTNNVKLNDRLDKAQFDKGQIDARLQRNEMGISDVTGAIGDAYYRKDTFDSSAEGIQRLSVFINDLNGKLRSVGFYMDPTTTSFDSLIDKLRETRERLLDFRNIDLSKQASAGFDIAKEAQNKFRGFSSRLPFVGADASVDEVTARMGFAGVNTRSYQNASEVNRQRSALYRAVPGLEGFFSGTGRVTKGNYQASPYEELLKQAQSLDPAKNNSKDYSALQARFSEFLTQIAFAKSQQNLEAIAKIYSMTPEELTRLINQVEAELRQNYEQLDSVKTNLIPLERLSIDTGRDNIRNQLVRQFEAQQLQMGQKISSEGRTLINSDFARNNPLSGYRQYVEWASNVAQEVNAFNEQVKQAARDLIEGNPELSVKEDLAPILNNLEMFGNLNNVLADTKKNKAELAPGALRALRSQNDIARRRFKDEMDTQELLLSDAQNEDQITSISMKMQALQKAQYERDKELAILSAGDDEETKKRNLDDLAGQYAAQIEEQQQRLLMRLAKFYTKDAVASGNLSDSTLSRASSKAMVTTLQAQSRDDNAQEQLELNTRKAQINALKEEAKLLEEQAAAARRKANTSYLSPEERAAALADAQRLTGQATAKRNSANESEIDSLNEFGRSKSERAQVLKQLLEGEASPEVKQAIQAILNSLEPEIAKIAARIVTLSGREERVNFRADNALGLTEAKYAYTQAKGDPKFYRAAARDLDDSFKVTRAEAQERLRQRQTEAEVKRTEAEELKRIADENLTAARDAGMPETQQFAALQLAQMAMQKAGDAMGDYLRAQLDAVQQDLDFKRQQLADAEKMLATPDLNPLLAREYQQEINRLKPEIATSERDLEKMGREITRNTAETEKQTKEIRGNTEQLKLAGRRYLTEERRKMAATIYGSTYQTDAQVGRGLGEISDPGTKAGTLGQQFKNGLGDVFNESYKAYEGIDALTEGMIGLREILSGAGDEMGSFFAQFATGSLSAGDAFRGFTVSVLQSMTEMTSKIAMNMIMQQILSFAMASFMPAAGPNAGSPNAYATGIPAWTGGPVPAPRRYYGGGQVTGGMRSRDSTLIHAAQGEFVLRQAAVDAIGLEGVKALNNLDKNTVKSLESVKPADKSDGPEGDKTVNVWVVSEEEAKQGMDDQSILVVVDKALMRNSSTKKLVKRISMGDM